MHRAWTSTWYHFRRAPGCASVSSTFRRSAVEKIDHTDTDPAATSLAYAEVRIALASLFRDFDFVLDEKMTPEDTQRLDCFTTSVKGSGLRVYCTARN